MSGGSYNYLYMAEAYNLLQEQNKDTLEEMIARIKELDPHSDAAKDAEKILFAINVYENVVASLMERLSPVFKAVEWYDSHDSGIESVYEAFKNYK